MARELIECVACGNAQLKNVVDLGEQPLANGFHLEGRDPPRFPLALNKCETCSHCQLSHAVDPVVLFKHYLYVSGTSQTALSYFRQFAKMVSRKNSRDSITSNIPLASENKTTAIKTTKEKKRVLEIACNDGSQLDAFAAFGWETHGVDPAENIVGEARLKGHHVVTAFWDEKSAAEFAPLKFDVIVAQNVVAHTAEPAPFLRAMLPLCTPTTDVYIQTSQIDMLFNGEFDTMYHEHISFFCIRSMQRLANRCGFTLEEVFKVDLHGGSAVFRLRKAVVLSSSSSSTTTSSQLVISPLLKDALEREEKRGISDPKVVIRFAEIVRHSIQVLQQLVTKAKADGYGVVGFGAAAKSMTVLCAASVSLDYIVDDNPLKQNLLSPGMNIPIVLGERLAADPRPLLIIVLAWNFAPEIIRKIRTLRKSNKTDKKADRIIRKYIFSQTDSPENVLETL